MFWMSVPSGHGKLPVDDAVAPANHECDEACRAEFRALAPYDAFGTLMTTLAQRLKLRGADEETTGTSWSRLEEAWGKGSRSLAAAGWKTPATSCVRAQMLEAQRKSTSSA